MAPWIYLRRSYLRTSLMGLLVLLAATACVQESRQGDTQVDALLWSTASAEYEIIARQIFFQAQRQMDKQLAQKDESAALEQQTNFSRLPPAVIVEVDETILSNGVFHYQLLSKGETFDEETNWAAWVNEARSKPVPGALEYLNNAAKKGVTVFYVTNRNASLYEPTWRNLRQAGFPLETQNQLLMRGAETNWSWDKVGRRETVAKQYRIIQMIGDGLDDFMPSTEHMTPEERRSASNTYMAYWGEKWFMLPNPVYGDWESAIFNAANHNGTPLNDDRTKAKYRFIRGGESQGVW
jgi:5'-nucleotidase (lipoprotein e(P4) family)